MIYLDNAATTKPYDEVIDVMSDVMRNHWGNPSATYTLGDDTRRIIEDVRDQIAEDINASPDEIIFTSGACEANSLAIDGFLKVDSEYNLCVTTKMEHASIQKADTIIYPCLYNDNFGFVHLSDIAFHGHHPGLDGCLVSVAAANGEVGTIQDIKAISDKVHSLGGIFHTDTTQLFPERRIDVKELGIDMMSVSAQKFNGPKGIGFLYVKNGIELAPIIYGSQENGLRGGTYNTAAIAGMGEALKITRKLQKLGSVECLNSLRNRLLDKLMQTPGVTLNGPPVGNNRLVNNINITIDGVDAEQLVTLCSLNEIYISKGSACQSYDPKPSHVLKEIGLTDEQAFNTIRITLGYQNTEEEIDIAGEIITKLINNIRNEGEKR